MPKFVDIETPYMGKNEQEMRRNILYLRASIRNCLMRGEIGFASHAFFTQPGVLDDNVPEERKIGIDAGKTLIDALPGAITAVYTDLGISKGMQFGIDHASAVGRQVEYRSLGDGWEKREIGVAMKHSHASLWGFDPTKHQLAS